MQLTTRLDDGQTRDWLAEYNRKLGEHAWRYWVAFYIVALISLFFVYGHSLGYFFWQDDFYLLDFVSREPLTEYTRIAFTPPTDILPLNFGVVFRPLTHYVYFKLCYLLFGLEPALYRLLIMFTLFLSSAMVAKYCQMVARNSAYGFIAGILFLISRTHLTPLYWITSSAEIILTCFMLLSMIGYLASLERTSRSRIYYGISIVSLAIALLCKENAVVLPAIIVVSVFLRLGHASFRERLSACYRLWPHLLIVSIFAVVRLPLVTYALGGGGKSYYTIGRLANLGTSYIWGFWWHVETFVEPWRMVLNGLTRTFSLFQPMYLSIASLILLIAGALWLIRSKGQKGAANPIWLGLAWFIIAPAPALVTGILADYLFSIAAVGFAMAVAYLAIFVIGKVCRESAVKGSILVTLFLAVSVISARLVALSLENTAWPVKYMPPAAETIAVAKQNLSTSASSQAICLIDFPRDTWWPGRAQAAFHVFIDAKISVHEVMLEDPNPGKCSDGDLKLKYSDGEIVVERLQGGGKESQ